MQLTRGARLGHYEILSAIGAGGMGEVYEARDTRLDRRVAIKILPAAFANDPQRRSRFEREAKAISALNHPNICTLHDVGQQDGVHFLVLELIEGESLASRLNDGPLRQPDLLTWGTQIANALECAHRQNIVHRDLKPGNIMITRSGVKVLDFGLARTPDPIIVEHDAETRTQDQPLTREGAIVGTFEYMAPEQLQGLNADRRTDIFSLGVILYEMSTGHRPFTGDSRAGLIAAILNADPAAVSDRSSGVPPSLDRIILRCLKRDPDDRWQSAHDISVQLQAIAEVATDRATSSSRNTQTAFWTIGALALLMAGFAGFSFFLVRRTAPHGLHTAIPIHQGGTIRVTTDLIATIAPDGKYIAYTAFDAAGISRLFIRNLSQDQAVLIPGTDDAYNPFVSPDGRWVAFCRHLKLQKVSLGGGPPVDVANAGPSKGGTWGVDGFLYYTPTFGTGIWRVPSEGGRPKEFTVLDRARGESSHRWPQALPDGKHLLFTIKTDNISSFDQAEIAVMSLETGKRKTVVEGSFGRYLPTGHLVFLRGGALFGVRFDLDRLELKGTPVKLVDHVAHDPSSGVAQFAASDNGILTFIPGGGTKGDDQLIWVDRQGQATPAGSRTGNFGRIDLSPDGHRVVMTVAATNDDVFMYDLEKDLLTRFTFDAGDEAFPTWTPDGKSVVYGSQSSRGRHLLIKSADGGGESRELLEISAIRLETFTSDGRMVVASEVRGWQEGASLVLYRLDNPRVPPVRLTTTQEPEYGGRFSSDGELLAYVSEESGRAEVYVRTIDGDRKWQVSSDGGTRPEWSHDGSEIFYTSGSKLYAVDVGRHPRFSLGRPTLLFERPYFRCNRYIPVGDRFLMCRSADADQHIGHLTLITDWFDDVKTKTK